MKLSSKFLLIGAALLVAFALYYFKRSSIVGSENERFTQNLERINRVDALFNQDVLKVRFGLLENYDSFGEQSSGISEALQRLKNIPGFIDASARSSISQKIEELSVALTEKGQLLEAFKSQNAVLKNSLLYFPVAGSELIKRLDATREGRELEFHFNDLIRRVLAYSLGPSADQEKEILSTLGQISDWRNRHPEFSENALAGSVSAHAESILKRQPKVEGLIRRVVSVPTAQRAEELVQLYDSQFARAVHSAELYRGFLYGLCFVLAGGIAYTLYALRTANVDLQGRTQALAIKNDELQSEIAERKLAKAELEKTHKDLIESSRLAGMAEVATSVLHNVGNVLNSVNVASSCVADSLRKSKSADLEKVVAVMREHEADLGEFITRDSKGKHMVAYLAQLSTHLKDEQSTVLKELAGLQKNIEHIKDIVTMQQSFAKVSGVAETINVADLVEDALNMHVSGLNRHDIKIRKEIEDVPPITIEKHKVLQILVNLVRNAKHACQSSERIDRQLTLRVCNGGDRIKVVVIDNGIGIPPQNLTRIFGHGFTTKKGGHGFGLHSGVLAAQEMGGTLTAHSDGVGQGATFTLELPCKSSLSTPSRRKNELAGTIQ